ncbi:MAG: hypothetical protein QXH13_04435 [Thermoplasmata archaeon]
MSRAVKVLCFILAHLPALILRLIFCYLILGHRRRWAVYRFRKQLRKHGIPREIADKLAIDYESFITLSSLKRFLI